MGVTVKVTYSCGGCGTTAEAPELTVTREFVSVSGRDHGVGGYVQSPVDVVAGAPEGWVPFDPWTQATYCPECWAQIDSAEPEPATAGESR